MEYIKAHTEKRAEDLLQAFCDPETDMILCAIGKVTVYKDGLAFLLTNGEEVKI